MMPEQADLLRQAHDSLAAAKILDAEGYHGFAASRAYYTMFYITEVFLLGQGLAFSRHSAVHAAFGEHFVKTGVVPPEFHRYLIRGMEVRHAGDYGREVPPSHRKKHRSKSPMRKSFSPFPNASSGLSHLLTRA